jgi:EAL domain-containing protein (putative c-di-GMP-specific phosphodiesterase class I)
LPLAEETGLIIPISLWVLREACRQLALWRREFAALKLTMGVNVSAKHFADSQLADTIRECLADCDLPGESLPVEIIEQTILDCSPDVIARVGELRALGVSINLDDFGTGYSALSYLHRFPFDALKIDRGFVSTLQASGKNEEIIRSILMLGHDMNLQVIAEGIETPMQVARLRELGCQFGQGFLFAKPFNSSMAYAFLESAASGLPGGVLHAAHPDRAVRPESADSSRTR